MAIISDPDLLVDGRDVIVDVATKTIKLVAYNATTNPNGVILSEGATGGVSGQTLYSWLKERWKTNQTYIKYPFPMEAITPESMEFLYGWVPFDDATRKLIRTTGWAEKNMSNIVTRRYMGVVSLGSLGTTDQPYFRFGTNTSTNFTYNGPVNESVQIYGDASNGDFDFTDGDSFDLYCREQGKTYAYSNNSQIGAPVLSSIVYRFPLSNAVDLKITASDTTISTTSPWTTINVQYYAVDQMYDVDGDAVTEPYRIVVTDASGTASTQQIYEKIQYLLRQDSDIDAGAGTVNGKVASTLLSFVGDTLVGSNGVFISNLNDNYLNVVDFYDYNGVVRRYPYVAAGIINFGSNAGIADFKFWMFFSETPSGNYGTSNAVIVNDKDGNPISGVYAGTPVSFTFAYDSNTQGGRTGGTNALVKVVGIGLSGGQFIAVDHIITRSSGQSILLAPALERNYANS